MKRPAFFLVGLLEGAGEGVRLVEVLEGFDFVGRELDGDGGDGVVEVLGFSGADDGGGDVGLREDPGERNL